MTHRVETGPGWELREGRWQEVLADVAECDALITDPPYSERTHAGALDATTLERGVSYCHLTGDDARAFVIGWSDRVAGWMVIHTDDILHPTFRAAYTECGRYAFPWLPVLQQQPRVTGDGPPSAGHLLAVARPRERRFLSWGSLSGWYIASRDGSIVRGGKPLDLMRAIIRDYTRPGDLVVDPCAGGGTTLLAAVMEGRRAIGAEMDPTTFGKAVKRLRKGFTAPLTFDAQPMEQTGLVFPAEAARLRGGRPMPDHDEWYLDQPVRVTGKTHAVRVARLTKTLVILADGSRWRRRDGLQFAHGAARIEPWSSEHTRSVQLTRRRS